MHEDDANAGIARNVVHLRVTTQFYLIKYLAKLRLAKMFDTYRLIANVMSVVGLFICE